MLVRRDLQAVRGVPIRELFILLGDPRPFGVPGVGIVRPRALRDLELVGVARVHRLHEPDLELTAAGQSLPRKQHLFVPAADDAELSFCRSHVLSRCGHAERVRQGRSAGRREPQLHHVSPADNWCHGLFLS